MDRRILAALLLLPILAACEKQQAYGDANAIVVGTPADRWSGISDRVQEGLQPTIFTVRNEQTFRLRQEDPEHPDWPLLRQFRQVLLIGSPDEPFMAEAVESARGRGEDVTHPGLVQTFDVWARGQVVSLMLVPPGGGPDVLAPLVDSLHVLLDRQFRQISTTRMYASGRNDSLMVQLQRDHGFSLDFPRVYYWDRQDSVFVFRNDNPDPTRLIRQVAVTWRTPIPAEPPTVEQLVEWRQGMVDGYYQDEQVTEVDQAEFTRGRLDGREMVQLQAVWANPPGSDWPRGGPMTLRAVSCPEQDRLYLVDAWLFAPGDDKYQYMIQLETILNSFRCGEQAPPESSPEG